MDERETRERIIDLTEKADPETLTREDLIESWHAWRTRYKRFVNIYQEEIRILEERKRAVEDFAMKIIERKNDD